MVEVDMVFFCHATHAKQACEICASNTIVHVVLLLPSCGSIRELECSKDSPWYPSENAQVDASGPMPACVAIAVSTGYSEPEKHS